MKSLFFVGFLFVVSPLYASSITIPMQGCVSLNNLKTTSSLTWTSDIRMLTGAFHDPTIGCEPTILEPLIHALTFIYPEDGGENVILDLEPLRQTCGRYQFDFENRGDELSMVSLMINTQLDCDHHREPEPPEDHHHETPEPATIGLTILGLAVLIIRRHI